MAYVVGTHPTVSTTFVDREIAAMAATGVGVARILSIREPAVDEVVRGGRGLGAELSGGHVPVAYLLAGGRLHLLRTLVAAFVRRPGAIARLGAAFLRRPPTPDGRRGRALFHLAEGLLAFEALRGRDIEYVHAQFGDRAATVARVAARLLRVPFGVTVHGGDLQLEAEALPARLRDAAIVATVTEWNRDELRRRCPALEPDRFLVYRPFIDLAAITPREAGRASDDVSSRPLRILSVGRLVEKKGHTDLIEACRIAVARGLDLRCRIVGGGPLEARLRAQAAAVPGGKVEIVGPRPFDDVLDELAGADVFALASTAGSDGDRDGLPVAIGEAMASGLPVISTRVVGIPELVRGGAGILVEPGAPDALAAAIEVLAAEGPARRAERGRMGRTIAERDLDVRAEARKLEAAIRAAVAAARDSRRRHEAATSRTPRPMVLVWGEPYRAPRSRLLAAELGARLAIVSPPGWSKTHAPLGRFRRAGGYGVQAARTLWALAWVRPTGILVQHPPTPAVVLAAAYCAAMGRPLVIDVHSGALVEPMWRRPRRLVERIFRRAAAVVVHAPRWVEVVDGWGGRPILLPDVPNHRAVLAPEAASALTDRRAEAAERGAAASRFDVAVVASASEDEPLGALLDAAAELPWARFRVTGPLAAANGHRRPVNVEFTGLLDEDDYLGLLRAADAVMALTTLPDTMQGGALQGLALGRPIVTSNTTFLREWFSDAAVYVNADAASIAGGVTRVRTERAALEAAGVRVAAQRAAETAAAMRLVREALQARTRDARERRRRGDAG